MASLVSATFKGGFFASRALLSKATWLYDFYDFFEILLQDGDMVVQIGDFLDRVVDRDKNRNIGAY